MPFSDSKCPKSAPDGLSESPSTMINFNLRKGPRINPQSISMRPKSSYGCPTSSPRYNVGYSLSSIHNKPSSIILGDNHPHLRSRSRHAHQIVSRPTWGHVGSTSASSRILNDEKEKLSILTFECVIRCP